MPNFYTRSGDDGYTGRLGAGRLPKPHDVIEAVGSIDEASAALGMARATCQAPQSQTIILQSQRDLYDLMAEVSASKENAARFRKIDTGRVNWLEDQIAGLSAIVQIPNDFIIPGDSTAGAALGLARTIVRRAERRVTGLYLSGEIESIDVMRYLNRLSSLCFVLELLENQVAGSPNLTLAKE